jgi:hypothetical protein
METMKRKRRGPRAPLPRQLERTVHTVIEHETINSLKPDLTVDLVVGKSD